MLESIGTWSSDISVPLASAATAVAALSAIVAAAAGAGPRPCWKGHGCLLKADDANACARCPVYVRRHAGEFDVRDLPSLGEIRRLNVIGAATD